MMYGSWNIVCDRQMDRWMDREKKWHVEVGPPTKKVKKSDKFGLYTMSIQWTWDIDYFACLEHILKLD